MENGKIWRHRVTYFVVSSEAAEATVEDKDDSETALINELLGAAAKYEHRARPQFDAVNVSFAYVLQSILELVGYTTYTVIYVPCSYAGAYIDTVR